MTLPIETYFGDTFVRAVATAPSSDKALVVYERDLLGVSDGRGLYASFFDGTKFGTPQVLVQGSVPYLGQVMAEILPVSEKAVVAFSLSNGLTTEVFASFFDGAAFSEPRAVTPAPRDSNDSSAYALVASRTADVAALVLSWPLPPTSGPSAGGAGWVLPVGPAGVGALKRLDDNLGDVRYVTSALPLVTFLPSGRALFCAGGSAVGADVTSPAAWCVPYAAGAFEPPLVVAAPQPGPFPGKYGHVAVSVAASPTEDKALLAFSASGYDPHPGTNNVNLYASTFDGESFAPATLVTDRARLPVLAEAAFAANGEALLSYRRQDGGGPDVLAVARAADSFAPAWNTETAGPAYSSWFVDDLAFRAAPDVGGLFAFVAPYVDGVALQTVWYDGQSFGNASWLQVANSEQITMLPRSRRAVAAFGRYEEGLGGQIRVRLLAPEGSSTETGLGATRRRAYGGHDDDVGVVVSATSDRALVVTPRPRVSGRALPAGAGLGERVEASASLFDGTTFTPLASVGNCSHAVSLNASGRLMLVCPDGELVAKVVE